MIPYRTQYLQRPRVTTVYYILVDKRVSAVPEIHGGPVCTGRGN